MQTFRENTEILIETNKDIDLEVNFEKPKHMITSRQQNRNVVIENLSFENVEKFKYLGVTVTYTNDIREGIERSINMGNACYYSFEKILSSSPLSKKLKVSYYTTGCILWL